MEAAGSDIQRKERVGEVMEVVSGEAVGGEDECGGGVFLGARRRVGVGEGLDGPSVLELLRGFRRGGDEYGS